MGLRRVTSLPSEERSRAGLRFLLDTTGSGAHWNAEIDLFDMEKDLVVRNGGTIGKLWSTGYTGVRECAPGHVAIVYDLAEWQESATKAPVRWTLRLALLREA